VSARHVLQRPDQLPVPVRPARAPVSERGVDPLNQARGPRPGTLLLSWFERALAVVLDVEALGLRDDRISVAAEPPSDAGGGASGHPCADAGVEGRRLSPTAGVRQCVEPVPDPRSFGPGLEFVTLAGVLLL